MTHSHDYTNQESISTKKSYFVRAKHDKENPYVMVSKSMFRDKSISLKAKGLLGYLLCLPDSWKVNPKQVAEYLDLGRDQIYSGVKELISAGYCRIVQEKEENGRFSQANYEFSENPIFKKCLPCTENPDAVSQVPENPYLKNTELKNTDVKKKENKKEKPPAPKGEEPAIADSFSFFSSKDGDFSQYVIDQLKNHNPKYIPKAKAPIAKELEALSKENTFEEMRAVFDWAINNEFWQPHFYKDKNVGKYFASKFAQLYSAMNASNKSKPIGKVENPNKQIAKFYDQNYTSRHYNIEVKDDRVLIIANRGYDVTTINYSENGFQQQLSNEIRKKEFDKVL